MLPASLPVCACSCCEVEGPSSGITFPTWLALPSSLRRARDEGRERVCRERVGPTEDGADMFSVWDGRRSGGKGDWGIITRGSYGGFEAMLVFASLCPGPCACAWSPCGLAGHAKVALIPPGAWPCGESPGIPEDGVL